MNTETAGAHISLRHSSLWRKPLVYEKYQKALPQCHLQMNESKIYLIQWELKAAHGQPETTQLN